MTQNQFDAYRQGIWNQGAAIVDEHDSGQGSINDQIGRLAGLLAGFQAEYDSVRGSNTVAASWLDPRFHDYYDFLANILEGWRAAAGGAGGYYPAPGGVEVPNGGGSMLRTVYRMILFVPDRGIYGTGANYPTCSREDMTACDGQEFPNLQAAVDYARSRDETPVYIDLDYDPGIEEVWRIAEGGEPWPPKSAVIETVDASGNPVLRAGFSLASVPMLAWVGLGAALLLGRKK